MQSVYNKFMLTRELVEEDKDAYEEVAIHPLQSWVWGQFRQKTGVEVVRIGNFEGEKLLSGFQLTFHQLPQLPYTIGYFPKGVLPDKQMLESLTLIGNKKNAIFIKLEPNVIQTSDFRLQTIWLNLLNLYLPNTLFIWI
jgi:lipid II:glycine glycyltransferase (peptidoglycan interpeptide bridge formation enzyme)